MLEFLLPAATSLYRAHSCEFDAVACALADAPADASRQLAERYADIDIGSIANLLLDAGAEMLKVLAIGAGIGGALGAAAGLMTGGLAIGATTAIGAAVGAELALVLSNAIGIVVSIEENIAQFSDALFHLNTGIQTAWRAGEAEKHSPAYEMQMLSARQHIATALVILVGIILLIIIAVILKKKPGLEKFQNSKLGQKLERWADKNKQNLERWYDRKVSGGERAADEPGLSEWVDSAKEKVDGVSGDVRGQIDAAQKYELGDNGVEKTSPLIGVRGGAESVENVGVVTNSKPFDLNSLKSIDVDGLKAQRIVQGDNGKVAVIGRAMGNDKVNGVRDYAAVLQKQGYDVELFDGDMIPRSAKKEFERLTEGGRWLTNPDLVKSEMYQANKAWAQKIKSEGYTIIDLGNPHNQGFSPFYAVEKLTIFGGGR